jgi:hypothetical protein
MFKQINNNLQLLSLILILLKNLTATKEKLPNNFVRTIEYENISSDLKLTFKYIKNKVNNKVLNLVYMSFGFKILQTFLKKSY